MGLTLNCNFINNIGFGDQKYMYFPMIVMKKKKIIIIIINNNNLFIYYLLLLLKISKVFLFLFFFLEAPISLVRKCLKTIFWIIINFIAFLTLYM